MELSPEEYGDYWGGSLRMAAGVVVFVLTFRFLDETFLVHASPLPRLFGWVIFVLVTTVCCFAVGLGVARIVRTAVDAELG